MNEQLDLLIDRQHSEAVKAEETAKAIADRMALIPGAESFARSKRSYGNPPNPWAGQGNLSAQAAVLRHDPGLARYLANLVGASLPAPDYAAMEQQERLNASARRLEAQVETMRQQRMARQQQAERERTYGRRTMTGGWA